MFLHKQRTYNQKLLFNYLYNTMNINQEHFQTTHLHCMTTQDKMANVQ